jgi:hypothetical protein
VFQKLREDPLLLFIALCACLALGWGLGEVLIQLGICRVFPYCHPSHPR